MNTDTGRIGPLESFVEEKKSVVTELTEQQFMKFSGIPEKDRPLEWALSNFLTSLSEAKRARPLTSQIREAFKAGWDGAESRQTRISGSD